MATSTSNTAAAGHGASANGEAEAHDPSSRPKKNRNALILDSYETEMAKARSAALTVGSLYALSRFLAFCNIAWGTVVLLRAFVRYLRLADFAMVTALLLVEAARWASAPYLSRLATGALASLSQSPEYNEEDQHKRDRRVRVFSQVLQVFLTFPSLIFPLARLLQAEHFSHDIPNVQNVLRIFYVVVIINAAVSSLALICSAIAFTCLLNHSTEQSIQRYYDEILQRTFSSGVVLADDFEFFDFAYKMLGREHARNVPPQVVVKHHRKLMEYLYAHRQGLDVLLIYLDAGDAFVQQAAANMVGFWVDRRLGLDLLEVKLPAQLLTKLAEQDEVTSTKRGSKGANKTYVNERDVASSLGMIDVYKGFDEKGYQD